MARRLKAAYLSETNTVLPFHFFEAQDFFGLDITRCDIKPEKLGEVLSSTDFDIFLFSPNFCKNACGFVDITSSEASDSGQVTAAYRKDGRLLGVDLTSLAIKALLKNFGIAPEHGEKVLILGSSQASVSLSAVLKREFYSKAVLADRIGDTSFDGLAMHRDAAIIINATDHPLSRLVTDIPLSADYFRACRAVIDLAAISPPRSLCRLFSSNNTAAVSGAYLRIAELMLIRRLFESDGNGTSAFRAAYVSLITRSSNIVLIGDRDDLLFALGSALAHISGRSFSGNAFLFTDTAALRLLSLGGTAFYSSVKRALINELYKSFGIICIDSVILSGIGNIDQLIDRSTVFLLEGSVGAYQSPYHADFTDNIIKCDEIGHTADNILNIHREINGINAFLDFEF